MNDKVFPSPRICILNKPIGINEYGFDLHAEMGKGQFVGAVDIGSPAEDAGLRPLDHILAVNGESIDGLSHKEVVQRIKTSSMGCSLLVLDEKGYIWANEHNLTADYFLQQINKNKIKHLPSFSTEPNEFVEAGQISQISPPSFREEYTTAEESGSCSIGLPFSGSNSPPYSSKQQKQQQIPMEMTEKDEEIFSNGRATQQQQQQKQQIQKLNENNNKNNFISSPNSPLSISSNYSENKKLSPSSAAIGRHTAVPVLPPPSTLLANGPKPRLCLLIKSSPSQEFGFSLHAEGNGHFIGAVDSDGIAERAGLVTGQRIVGVNGHLVFPNTSHMDIVQIIQREPLRTELLVASEHVDRFYKEYGLAFSYDYVQFYDEKSIINNGTGNKQQLVGAAAVRSKQASNVAKNQNGNNSFEKGKGSMQRSRSGSRSVERNASNNNKNNGLGMRGRGQSLGKRPPTPSSTYMSPIQDNINGHVAVQIEKRSDNMTSIEIGEIDENDNLNLKNEENIEKYLFGIGTPPSSRCEEKLKNGNYVQNGEKKIINGEAGKSGRDGGHVENSKHVISNGLDSSPDSSIKSPPPIAAPRTPKPARRYSPPQPLEIYHPSQLQQYDISPYSFQSNSTHSGTSLYKNKDSEKNIFTLTAKEARKAICGRKRDLRLAGQMSLEEKHRLIMEM